MTTAGSGAEGGSRLGCEALGGQLGRARALLDHAAREKACGVAWLGRARVRLDRVGSESRGQSREGWVARSVGRLGPSDGSLVHHPTLFIT
jgi:hypothetical protein